MKKAIWSTEEIYDWTKMFGPSKVKWISVETVREAIEECECKGRTHGFRPKWICVEELLKKLNLKPNEDSK